MTKEKKSKLVNYLLFSDIETIYDVFYTRFLELEEPVPHWDTVDKKGIHNLIAIPQSHFYGKELYPSIEEKAAIIFYTINKGHIFPNGNKRMSVFCTLYFLIINYLNLEVSTDDLRNKALWLAQTESADFQEVKKEIISWLSEHIVENEKKNVL